MKEGLTKKGFDMVFISIIMIVVGFALAAFYIVLAFRLAFAVSDYLEWGGEFVAFLGYFVTVFTLVLGFPVACVASIVMY